jgi:hypothetical protein
MSNFFAQWIWYLIGAVGIGGTIALIVFLPAALPILQNVARFIFGTRLGFGLMFGIASFAIADTHRARLDQAEWNRKVASFEQQQKDRDTKIADDARQQVKSELAAEKLAEAATNKAQEQFNDTLKPLPPGDGPCRVGDDADKLRVISGQSGSATDGRVPQVGRPGVPAIHRKRH